MLMIKDSSYKNEFQGKTIERDQSCKPKNKYCDDGLKLQGNTEYVGEYKLKREDRGFCDWREKSVEELQNIIFNIRSENEKQR